jgi:hypothetical protein
VLEKCWMVLERCQRVLGSAQSIFYKTPPAPRVYFIRLLPRPEYILRLLAGSLCETYGK